MTEPQGLPERPALPEWLLLPPPRTPAQIGAPLETMYRSRRFALKLVSGILVLIGLGVAFETGEPSAAVGIPLGLGIMILPIVWGSPSTGRMASLYLNSTHVVGRVVEVGQVRRVVRGSGVGRRACAQWTFLVEFTASTRKGTRRFRATAVHVARWEPMPPDPWQAGDEVDLAFEEKATHLLWQGHFMKLDRVKALKE